MYIKRKTSPALTIAAVGFSLLITACGPTKPTQNSNTKSDYTYITHAHILTMNAQRDVLEDGCILIKGAVIEAVTNKCDISAHSGANIIDAEGGMVLPGMINLHNHLSMTAFRGLAESNIEDVHDRLYNYFFPLEKALLNRNLIRVSARHAAIELALGGVTTTTDMYYHEDEVAKSVKEVGLRGVLGETVIGFPVVDAPEPFGGLDYARTYLDEWKNDPLITPAIAPHAPYTVSPEILMEVKKLADEKKAPILLHMAEMKGEAQTVAQTYPNTTQNKSVVRYLSDLGFLGPNVLSAHTIYVDEADMLILKDKGVGVSHNPKANTKDTSGLSPAWRMYELGLDIGLGTDGPMSSNQMDILTVMPYASRVARLASNNTAKFEPVELVDMATMGGAKALNMDDKIGSLEVGKLADLIIVETRSPNMQPNYDPYATLAFSAYPSNIVLTMVNGDVIAKDGKVLNVDLEAHQIEWDAVTNTVAEFAKTLKK
jgi:cytosine/adenosine deaminase-related metal-dependent hydrolase